MDIGSIYIYPFIFNTSVFGGSCLKTNPGSTILAYKRRRGGVKKCGSYTYDLYGEFLKNYINIERGREASDSVYPIKSM